MPFNLTKGSANFKIMLFSMFWLRRRALSMYNYCVELQSYSFIKKLTKDYFIKFVFMIRAASQTQMKSNIYLNNGLNIGWSTNRKLVKCLVLRQNKTTIFNTRTYTSNVMSSKTLVQTLKAKAVVRSCVYLLSSRWTAGNSDFRSL